MASYNIYSIIVYLLRTIGFVGVFRKCGVKWVWALIPICREYHLGAATDREKDGRVFGIVSVLFLSVNIGLCFAQGNAVAKSLLFILLAALIVIQLIYMIRINLGLCETFGKSKKWLLALIFLQVIAMIIFGFAPSFVPVKKKETPAKSETPDVGDYEEVTIEKGLTVNIKHRMIKDSFKKRYLLKDIHLSIPRGHLVLLLGGSGAGKTTFVNAVIGYEKADADIELDNRNVYREYAGMKYDVGFVPQQDLMRGSDTVYRTLMNAAAMRLASDMPSSERKKRVMETLEDFGLAAVANSLVSKLSGGQRKRLSIAMEYIADPALFVLDEPDSGLDGVVARGLFEKLRMIADEGKVVITITHTPDRVIDLFDDVIVLAKDGNRTGRLAFYGSIEEAYRFFGKDSMEGVLLSINQKDEGGEGRANEFVSKFNKDRKAG